MEATAKCTYWECTKTTSLSKCARCKVVMYCGRECQKKDWAVHKFSCREPAKSEAEAAADSQTEMIEVHHRR